MRHADPEPAAGRPGVVLLPPMPALTAAGWAFFNLPTQMHERYSIPAVGLMTLLPLWGRRFWWPVVLVSISATLNIAHVGYFLFPPSKAVQDTVQMFIFNERHITWAFLAVIHVLMIPLTIEALWRPDGANYTESRAAIGYDALEARYRD